MKVVLDTNVFVSGIFFKGPSSRILKAWWNGTFQLAVSPEILEEYERTGEVLSARFPEIDLQPIWELVTVEAEIYACPNLPRQVCADPDDDKFIACALASRCAAIVSGDRHLLAVSGFQGIQIMKPREFMERYLP